MTEQQRDRSTESAIPVSEAAAGQGPEAGSATDDELEVVAGGAGPNLMQASAHGKLLEPSRVKLEVYICPSDSD